MTFLRRLFPWFLLAPALLPVVIWGGLIYPYLVPKTLLFYAFSFVSVAAFALLLTQGEAFYWQRLSRKEVWIPAALVVLAYVASIFGIDFYRSFWSTFVRGDGLLMLTCAAADFYLILLVADEIFFERLLRTVALVGSFVAVYGIGEWIIFGGGRIGSLLGNAAFFAGYLVIALFATLAAARNLPRAWRHAAYVGAALEVIAVMLSATRGSMLALGVVLLGVLACFAFKGEGKRRLFSLLVLAALVVLGGAFFALRTELANVPFQPIARIATIGTHDPDVASRLFIWKNMLGEIAAHPLLGVGTEHIDVLFNKFYDPTQIEEEWFDRSHNAFLDYAAQYGVLGFLLYCTLIGSFLIAARRLWRLDERMLAGLFALLALGYAVQNFFVFDTISSFWLLLALLAAALAASSGVSERTRLALPAWCGIAGWAAAVVLILLIVPVSVRPLIAAYDLAHAYAYQLVNPAKEIAYLNNGLALHTYGDLEYGYEAYAMYADEQATQLSGQPRINAYNAALSILTADFNRYPYDARTALYLAHVLSLAPPEAPANNDLLSAALARAIAESPKRSQPWYILANLSLSSANAAPAGSTARAQGYAAAKDILNRYIALVPTLAEPHFVLAQLLLASGDSSGAAAEAALGKAYYVSDLQTATRAAGFYESLKDWQDALFFLTDAVKQSPADYALLYDLAKVTYLSGDPAGADRIVGTLRASDPSILSSDPSFMSVITSYEQSAN